MAMKPMHRLIHQLQRPDGGVEWGAPSAATTWCVMTTDRSWSYKGRRTPSMSQGPTFRSTLTRSRL